MKKMLLILTVACGSFFASAQVSVTGISPASIAGNYTFEWADPVADASWATPDLNIPGTFIQAELMLVETGEAGTNPQGNPISQEGCATLINDLSGKIAVVYRNTCEFGAKAKFAQDAGAIGVIILNRDNEVIGMAGGVEGINVTIPVVMLSSVDGESIVNEMANGPVVMFIGNKVGLYNDDAGSNTASIMLAPTGTTPKFIADNGMSFMVGIEVLSYGVNTNDVTVNATVVGPSGEVYNETVGPVSMSTQDVLSIFDDSLYSFPQFTLPSYEAGDYTLTYTVDIGVTDESPDDNVFVTNFSISEDGEFGGVLSRASSNAGALTTNTFPSNAVTDYKACMYYKDDFASPITGVEGFHFSVGKDTLLGDLAGTEIFLEVFEWNDVWTTLSAGVTFTELNQIAGATHTVNSNAEYQELVYVPLTTPVVLASNQNYLFCLQTFDPEVYFGADRLDFNANVVIYDQPISPINIDGTWYAGQGWGGATVSLGVQMASNLGLEEYANVFGSAYPNPANDVVTVSVAAQGNANLTITDVSGKTAYQGAINLATGKADVNVSALETGMYIFNVKFENGQTSQFNVVKR